MLLLFCNHLLYLIFNKEENLWRMECKQHDSDEIEDQRLFFFNRIKRKLTFVPQNYFLILKTSIF